MHACYLPSLSIKSRSSLLKPKVSAKSISVTTERPLSNTASLVVYRALLGSKADDASTSSLDDHGETSRRHTVVDGAITIGFRAQSIIESHRETSCCKQALHLSTGKVLCPNLTRPFVRTQPGNYTNQGASTISPYRLKIPSSPILAMNSTFRLHTLHRPLAPARISSFPSSPSPLLSLLLSSNNTNSSTYLP
jgi:hypothetical protein